MLTYDILKKMSEQGIDCEKVVTVRSELLEWERGHGPNTITVLKKVLNITRAFSNIRLKKVKRYGNRFIATFVPAV